MNHCSKEPPIHVYEFELKNLAIITNAEKCTDWFLVAIFVPDVNTFDRGVKFLYFSDYLFEYLWERKKCSLVFLSALLSISNDTNEKGEQTLTTAEINEIKKLKNTIEKTQRWNNSDGITGSMFQKPVNMKNLRDEIIKKAAKKVRERPKRPLMPRKHYSHPSHPSSYFKHQEQKLAL